MNTIRTAAAVLLLGAVVTLGGCAAPGNPPMPGMGPGGASLDSDTNAADVMFTQMMIPHHEQAIEMADLILGKDQIGTDIRDLAEDIKAAQQPEIDQMATWLNEWGMDMSDLNGDHGGHGGGMMSDSDMAALEDAVGDEASALFLEQMIEHHEGAVEMAEDVLDDGSNPDVRALAESIVESQTAEIEVMRELLGDL